MRLILFSDPDLPDPEGSFQQAHRLAAELRARGCRVLHATPREPGRPPAEHPGGITLPVTMPGEGPVGRAAFRLAARWALRRWVAELGERPPALIHAHLSIPAVWLSARAASELEVPWALTAAGSGVEGALQSSGRRGGVKAMLLTAAGVIAPSEKALHRLEPWVSPTARRAVIPCGVEAVTAPLPEEPVVLGIGRQERERGFDGLLRAFGGVHRRLPHAVLQLAGEGRESRRLKSLARSLPSEVQAAIRWEGMPGPERAAKLFRAARVVAFPSRGPGAELGIAQAMAAGRAVVVTQAAGFPENAIDGGNVLQVPVDDAGALASAILSLLEDRALAEKIAGAGQGDMVRRSSWTEVAAWTLELFRALTHLQPAAR